MSASGTIARFVKGQKPDFKNYAINIGKYLNSNKQIEPSFKGFLVKTLNDEKFFQTWFHKAINVDHQLFHFETKGSGFISSLFNYIGLAYVLYQTYLAGQHTTSEIEKAMQRAPYGTLPYYTDNLPGGYTLPTGTESGLQNRFIAKLPPPSGDEGYLRQNDYFDASTKSVDDLTQQIKRIEEELRKAKQEIAEKTVDTRFSKNPSFPQFTTIQENAISD